MAAPRHVRGLLGVAVALSAGLLLIAPLSRDGSSSTAVPSTAFAARAVTVPAHRPARLTATVRRALEPVRFPPDEAGPSESADDQLFANVSGLARLTTRMLGASELSRALKWAPRGADCGFARLFAALEGGERVNVVALGGSVTTGLTYVRSGGTWTYHSKVCAWLQATWPRAHVVKNNLGISAAGPSLLEPCVASRLPPGVHLVLLESAADFWSGFGARDDESAARAYERLLRQLLRRPSGGAAAGRGAEPLPPPVVLEVATPTFWAASGAASKDWPRKAMRASGRDTLTAAEASFSEHVADPLVRRVASHYDVPHALQRAAYNEGLGAGIAQAAGGGNEGLGAGIAQAAGGGNEERGAGIAQAAGGGNEERGAGIAQAAAGGNEGLGAGIAQAAGAAQPALGGAGAAEPWPPPASTAAGTAALLRLMRDRVHPAGLGHSHAAQLAIGLLQRALRAWVEAGGDGGAAHPPCVPAGPLPAPLYTANFETRATCARAEALRPLVDGTRTRGFAYEVEGTPTNPKPGLVAHDAGARLALRLDFPASEPSRAGPDAKGGSRGAPRARGAPHAAAPTAFYAQLGLLTSYAGGQGRANISCEGACECPYCLQRAGSCLFEGHIRRGPRVSLPQQLMVFARRPKGWAPAGGSAGAARADGSAPCTVLIDVLNETSSGGHKVKLTSVLTQLSMVGMWKEFDPFDALGPGAAGTAHDDADTG